MTLQPPLEERINQDLNAYLQGPAALDARLASLPAAEVLNRYRALIERVELRAAVRTRLARRSAVASEIADERRQIRTGGNR